MATIPSGSGTTIVFTTTGQSSQNKALDFQKGLIGLQNEAGGLTFNPVSSSGVVDATNPNSATVPNATVLNEIVSSGGSWSLGQNGQFTYISVASPSTLEGSVGAATSQGGNVSAYYSGDAIEAGGGVTYIANGNDNSVSFFDGNNTFDGNIWSDNVVAGGTGNDTINAGTGVSNVIYSGAGSDVITLQDTATSAAVGDTVFLGSGYNDAVVAHGQYDTIAASTSGNSIFGGSGSLLFVAESVPGIAFDSVVAGSGSTSIFGAANTDITFANDSTGSYLTDTIVAGGGNETLNGANAVGGFAFFGDSDTTASVSDTIVGGSGTNYFSTGAGTEDFTLTSGSSNFFDINTVTGGASLTIYDFSATNTYLESDSSSSSGSVVGGNYVVTLSDNTTVTFVGVTTPVTINHIT